MGCIALIISGALVVGAIGFMLYEMKHAPYSCHVCGKQFDRSEELNSHLRDHKAKGEL